MKYIVEQNGNITYCKTAQEVATLTEYPLYKIRQIMQGKESARLDNFKISRDRFWEIREKQEKVESRSISTPKPKQSINSSDKWYNRPEAISQEEANKRKQWQQHIERTCIKSNDGKFYVSPELAREFPQLLNMKYPKSMEC